MNTRLNRLARPVNAWTVAQINRIVGPVKAWLIARLDRMARSVNVWTIRLDRHTRDHPGHVALFCAAAALWVVVVAQRFN